MTRLSRFVIVGLGLLILVIAAAIIGPRACSRAQQEAAVASAGAARSDGLADAAIGAAADTASAMTNAADIAATTKENEDAIRSAPGATMPVPAAANDAGLRALCMRAAYRDQPRCAAMLRPRAGTAGR